MSRSISEQTTSIGVIADTALQQHLIGRLLADQGMQVSVNTSPDKFTAADLLTDVDLWYVDLALDEGADDFLDIMLGAIDTPVLIGDGQAPVQNSPGYSRWKRRFLSKLSGQLEHVKGTEGSSGGKLTSGRPERPALTLPEVLLGLSDEPGIPDRVWVIGASLGGPTAVKEFLDALPAGLPVAFVYAQHIDSSFQQMLADTIGRHSAFDVEVAMSDEPLVYGKTVLAAVDQEIAFNSEGCIEYLDCPWSGPYQPNIGQVMMNVLQRFGQACGTIIFSGMGEDGVEASISYRDHGFPVWAQSPESCASSAMPDAISEDGYCGYRGTPRELAAKLIAHIADEVRRSRA